MSNPRVPGLVSVIIPIFNAERFLGEAIESVLAQTYTHWELLLVDDGSTDGSGVLIKRYAELDTQRIHALQHPGRQNLGMCSARNLGVQRARGEFIALLDADDLWMPGKLECQLALLRSHPEVKFLCSPSIYFEQRGEVIHEEVHPLAPEGIYQPPGLLELAYPLGEAGAPCPSSFFMRYELMEEIGGFEELFNHSALYEDQALLAKIYLHATVYVGGTCWDKYRCHSESYSSKAVREGSDARMRQTYVAWLESYLRKKNVEDPKIWRAVRRLTFPSRYPILARARGLLRGAARRVLRPHSSTL